MLDHLLEWDARNQAEISRTRYRPMCLGLKLSAQFVQIDLAGAECQPLPAAAEGDHLHAKDTTVESAGSLDISDGQNDVIESVNHWPQNTSLPRLAQSGATAPR